MGLIEIPPFGPYSNQLRTPIKPTQPDIKPTGRHWCPVSGVHFLKSSTPVGKVPTTTDYENT